MKKEISIYKIQINIQGNNQNGCGRMHICTALYFKMAHTGSCLCCLYEKSENYTRFFSKELANTTENVLSIGSCTLFPNTGATLEVGIEAIL